MLAIITRQPFRAPEVIMEYQGYYTAATPLLPSAFGVSNYPTIDPWLRDNLAPCLAIDPQFRPDLAALLSRVEISARMPAAGYPFQPLGPHYESDHFIKNLIKLLIYDGNI